MSCCKHTVHLLCCCCSCSRPLTWLYSSQGLGCADVYSKASWGVLLPAKPSALLDTNSKPASFQPPSRATMIDPAVRNNNRHMHATPTTTPHSTESHTDSHSSEVGRKRAGLCWGGCSRCGAHSGGPLRTLACAFHLLCPPNPHHALSLSHSLTHSLTRTASHTWVDVAVHQVCLMVQEVQRLSQGVQPILCLQGTEAPTHPVLWGGRHLLQGTHTHTDKPSGKPG